MSITSIDALVTHYTRREKHCAAERDRVAMMEGKRITDKHRREAAAVWEIERRIARDTVSYLKTIQRRGLSAGRSVPSSRARSAVPAE